MVEIPIIVKEKINKLIELLQKDNIKIEKVILFGSYSRGDYNEWSDIDLALISDDFTGNKYDDKIKLIDYISKAGYDLSPIPFKKADFDNSYFAQKEILRNGITINYKN